MTTKSKAQKVATEDYVDAAVAGGGGGVTDHGALTGLGDDDHTQYTKADGSRSFTADVHGVTTVNGVSTSTTLTTKDYVDAGVTICFTYLQPIDAGLTSISGLTTAADKGIYTTASDTYATFDLTSTARSLLDDTSTSAMRTTLGLAIGSDVQAYDAELAALAGLTSAADSAPYFTGSGTAALMTVTSAARGLLDDSSTESMLLTLNAAQAPITSYLSSDYSMSSTTAAETGIAVTPGASKIYAVEGIVLYRATDTVTAPRLGFKWPSGLDDGCITIRMPSAVNVETMRHIVNGSETVVPLTTVTDGTYSYSCLITGLIVAGGSVSGQLKVTLASETDTKTVYAKKGSYIRLRQVY